MLTAIRCAFLSLILFIGLLGASCGGEEQSEVPPEYVLGKDSFASLLVDMALAESAVSMNVLNVRGSQIDSVYTFDPVRERGISPVVYDSTLRYYSRNPELYKDVYQLVLTRLSALESARKGVSTDSFKNN